MINTKWSQISLAILFGLCIGLIYLLVRQHGFTYTTTHGQGYSASVQKAAPAVVNIYTHKYLQTRKAHLNMPNTQMVAAPVGLGSGVIVSNKGYILTNYHVIKDADKIIIALQDGRQSLVQLVGSDPATDLALLKTDLANLPSIAIDESDKLTVGDLVLAIGNPFGIGQTVTMGIVSALGRNQLGLNIYENFIQTDAAINPGNSGGALINASGQLVGINTAIYSNSGGSQGIGFAIPASDAVEIMNDIIETGKVERGYLGIEARQITQMNAEMLNLSVSQGLLISNVTQESPAHKAGLHPGDILISINGESTINPLETRNQVAKYKPGKSISVIGIRGAQSFQTTITLGKQPMISN
ncbi:trypsin-like serine protease [Marinomonas agarivorans]|nr:trypsin-like serine protease [Marinomonas agarivorans]